MFHTGRRRISQHAGAVLGGQQNLSVYVFKAGEDSGIGVIWVESLRIRYTSFPHASDCMPRKIQQVMVSKR
jgi:hypothetical protein